MNKKISAILLSCVLCLSGCSLAREEVVSKEADRLVGVYLTAEYPDSNDEHWVESGTVTANTEFGEIDLPKRILPAEFDPETKTFLFPGLDGYALFEATVRDGEDVYTTSQSDLMDGTFHVTTTDFGDSFELSGTLYVEKGRGDGTWTANRVYQSADGLVYLDGSGNSYSGSTGSFSSKLEQTQNTTVNGKEEEIFTKVEFTIAPIGRLQKLLVHQYNAAGDRIDTRELCVTAEDQEVIWAADAAWAVVEEQFPDEVKRTAYDCPKDGAEEIIHSAIVLNEAHVGEAGLVFFRK